MADQSDYEEYPEPGDLLYGTPPETKDTSKFKIGDLVRLLNGKVPQRVIAVANSGKKIRAVYSSSGDYEERVRWRDATDFVLVKTETKKEEVKMAKLYQVTEEGQLLFGTFLAQNSTGQLVLELKGSGVVKAFDAKDVEEVKPYTVMLGGFGSKAKHYRTKADILAVGDVLLLGDGTVWRVHAINTKADNAEVLRKAVKLSTTPIEELDTTDQNLAPWGSEVI